MKLKRLGDGIVGRLVNQKGTAFEGDAIHRHLDALDGRLVEMIEDQMKSLRGAGFFCVAGSEDLEPSLPSREEAHRTGETG
jgi:hypothetical protein